ncbi:MAG: hypothetical protein AAF108_12010 [Planctomycetota bacterium]
MSVPVWLMITIFVAVDAVVVGAIVYAVRSQVWGPFVRDHAMTDPPTDPGPIAWSAKLGIWNAGLTFRVTADERAIHLTPAVIGSLLRLSAASIPWDAVGVKKVGRRYITLRVGMDEIVLPAAGLAGVLAVDGDNA